MKTNECISFSGVDGSGKTTITHSYLTYLAKQRITAVHVWSRYRNYLSKPFLGLMRLTGHNRKVTIDGVKIGYHDFSENALIAWAFLIFQWLDQVIDIYFRFRKSNKTIISDRCVIDTLVDLCIDTKKVDFILGTYGRSLVSLMPKSTTYFFIKRDKKLVHEMRPDVQYDENYDQRVELYNLICEKFGLIVINNDKEIKDVVNSIIKKLEQQN